MWLKNLIRLTVRREDKGGDQLSTIISQKSSS